MRPSEGFVPALPGSRHSSSSKPLSRGTFRLRRFGWQSVAALLFAGILAWLPSDGLKDRENYLAFLDSAPIIMLSWLDGDIIGILANEPLWVLLNAALSALMVREQALQILIFVPAAVVALHVLRSNPNYAILLLAFLLVPLVLKNHVIHLRQGAAVAVFLSAWFASSRRWRWPLMFCAPLLHSSFFFVFMLLAVAWLLRRLRIPTAIVIGVYVAMGLVVGLGLGQLARAIGARQGEEAEFDVAADASGLGFVYWSLALGLYLLQSRRFLRAHLLEVGTIVFYLATYFLSPFTGRVFESTLLLVLLSMLHMRGSGGRVLVASVLLFSLMQWLMLYLGARSVFTEI